LRVPIPGPLKTALIGWTLVLVGAAVAVIAAVVAVALPISLALLGVIALQLAGVLRKVPFSYNLRNVVVRWKTTALTAVAFTLVVALLTAMLGFVNGMYRLTANSGVPSNVIVLADGATDELFSNLGYGDIKQIETERPVAYDEDGKTKLASWEVYVVVNQPILTRRCPECGALVPVDRLGRNLMPHAPREQTFRDKLARPAARWTAAGSAAGLALLALAGLALGGALRRRPGLSGLATAGAAAAGLALGLALVHSASLPWLPVPTGPECEGSGADVTGARGRRFLSVRGVEDAVTSGKVHGLPLHEGGSWFSAAGVRALPGSATGEQAVECVIGEGLSRELGPDQGKAALAVGDVFELGPRKWVVTGILQSAGSTFDSEVWAKFGMIKDYFGKNTYTTCVLRTADARAAAAFAKDLTANYKKPAVKAQTEPEYYSSLNATNQQFLYAIAVVVVIMAIGSVFGVMNTMFAAISQRTKDIGVMRILGYTRWQVLASFFMEALALAVIGGVLGCALGSLCHGLSATSNIASGPGGGKSVVIRLIVDGWVLSIGMGFALFMGCVGGLVPALSAMRLGALESLR
jgi:hypothetical protein